MKILVLVLVARVIHKSNAKSYRARRSVSVVNPNFRGKINMLFTGLGRSVSRKNFALGLECTEASAAALGPYIRDLGRRFSRYGPPGR